MASFIFGWAPTVDGDVLPAQPFDPQAPVQSKDIPVMIGTTLHEFTASTYFPPLRSMTKEQVVEQIKKKYGERTDDFLKAFEQAYPGYQPKDLVDVDFIFRPGAVEQAKLKSAQQGAPVYMYMFAWELPEWEPYTADKGATMIFDNDCGMKYNHDKELLEVVMTFPVRGF